MWGEDGEGVDKQMVAREDWHFELLARSIVVAEEAGTLRESLRVQFGQRGNGSGWVVLNGNGL